MLQQRYHMITTLSWRAKNNHLKEAILKVWLRKVTLAVMTRAPNSKQLQWLIVTLPQRKLKSIIKVTDPKKMAVQLTNRLSLAASSKLVKCLTRQKMLICTTLSQRITTSTRGKKLKLNCCTGFNQDKCLTPQNWAIRFPGIGYQAATTQR